MTSNEENVAEQSVAHGAAEPGGLTMENRSPRPGERQRSQIRIERQLASN